MGNRVVERTSRVPVLAIAAFIMSIQLACAQSSDQRLSKILLNSAEKIYPAATSPTNETTIGREFRALGAPVLIPNMLELSDTLPSRLAILGQVPPAAGELISTPFPSGFTSILGGLNDDIQLSKTSVSGAAADKLKSSRLLLYGSESGSTPTKTYATYLDFQKRYNAALEQLRKETNAAARINLQARLNQLDSDWATFGMRAEVETALDDLANNAPDRLADLRKDFFSTLSKGEPSATDTIQKALFSAEWFRVSASSGEFGDITLVLSASGQPTALPKMSRFSYDVTLVELNRSILSHPFLASHGWRLRSGAILSDGNANVDSKSELLPRLTTHAVIIKNLEIVFSQEVPAKALQQISGLESVALSQIQIKGPQTGAPAYQARLISVPNPILLGVLVANLKKIPDPSIGVEWEN